jgi:yecA family protein
MPIDVSLEVFCRFDKQNVTLSTFATIVKTFGIVHMAKSMPDYASIQEQLVELQIPVSPSELHGAVTGCLCAGADLNARSWLAFSLTDAELDGKAKPGSALHRLFEAVSEQLAGDIMEFEFDLLLPDEDKPVSERGPAMVDWCQGFLGGFGVVPTPVQVLSEEADEALQDLAKIAGSDLNYEDTESDEEALIEVCEYIRVTAVLLYNERVVNRQNRQRLN